MTRNEEYLALLSQLEDAPLPPSLTDSVPKAHAKARRRRSWQASLISLSGAAAAFALAVNLSAPFALACGRVPILKDLAAAVATSPSMKAAIEHDYIQYVGQSQTENGITLALEYLILDRTQLNIFCTVSGLERYDSYFLHSFLSTPDGKPLNDYGVSGSMFTPGELGGFSVHTDPGVSFPENMLLTFQVTAMERTSDTATISLDTPAANHYDVEPQVIATLTFPITLDLHRLGPSRQVDIGQWIELDGQRLLVQTLDIDATQARLTVVSDPDNSKWCEGLLFTLRDVHGKKYKPGSWATSNSNYVAQGDDREGGQVVYYLESPYFDGQGPYTLSITRADWLDKADDKRLVKVDLTNNSATGLPQGVTLDPDCGKLTVTGQMRLAFRVADPADPHTLFSWRYYDGAGKTHHFNQGWQSGHPEENFYVVGFDLTNYPYDTIALELSHTSSTQLETPLEIEFE